MGGGVPGSKTREYQESGRGTLLMFRKENRDSASDRGDNKILPLS